MKRVRTPNLESKIDELLDKAVALISTKGEGVQLYHGLSADRTTNPYFDFLVKDSYNTEGILKRWEEEHGNRSITRSQPISREEFFTWLVSQPESVKRKVKENLQAYIRKPAGEEREQPRSEYFRD